MTADGLSSYHLTGQLADLIQSQSWLSVLQRCRGALARGELAFLIGLLHFFGLAELVRGR